MTLKRTIAKLNPVQLESLRLLATGKVPRVITLTKFIQLGLIFPGTFRLKPGVYEEMESLIIRNSKLVLRQLNGDELARALYARKTPPIL